MVTFRQHLELVFVFENTETDRTFCWHHIIPTSCSNVHVMVASFDPGEVEGHRQAVDDGGVEPVRPR